MSELAGPEELIDAALDVDSIHIVAVFLQSLDDDGLVKVHLSGNCFGDLRTVVKQRLKMAGVDTSSLEDDQLDQKATERWLLALRRIDTRHRDIDFFIDDFVGGELQYMFLDPIQGAISFHLLRGFGSVYMATIRQETVTAFRGDADRLANEIRRSIGLPPE